MTDPRPPDPDVTDAEAAELVRFLDGQLPADRAAVIESRLATEPALAAALERRMSAAAVINDAVARTQAPLDLRLRIDALGSPAARRPRRVLRWRGFAAIAGAAAAAAVVATVVLSGSELTVRTTLAAALRPPAASVTLNPDRAGLLRDRVDDVPFPNFSGKFGWRPVGVREDELEDRDTRTVFYEKNGRRIAYTIVAGAALEEPDAPRTDLGGVELRTLTADGRTVVTWQRLGHTCVLSGAGVDGNTLRELAAWKAKGAVAF